VEVLVAIAILGIVAVGLSQVLALSLQTWQQGLAQSNCYMKARTVLDTASGDIQRAVFRADVKNFPTPASLTAPTFTFYTRVPGVNTGGNSVRPVSLVTYQVPTSSSTPGNLLRSENTINWSPSSNLNFLQPLSAVTAAAVPTTPVPPNDLLCKGIAGFEMIFLLSDGSTVLAKYYQSPTSASVVMIGIAVAVVDDHAMTQLQAMSSGNFSKIQKALEDALASNFSAMTPAVNPTTGLTSYVSANYGRSIKALWDPAMLPIFQSASYPKSLPAGFQTFERFVPCTPFN